MPPALWARPAPALGRHAVNFWGACACAVFGVTASAQPQIVVSPSSLAQTLGPGATATQTLTVSNAGTSPLTFTADRGPAANPAGGPDAGGYTWTDSDRPTGPVFQWVDIRAAGIRHELSSVGDVWVDLPFSFPFYGGTYDRVKVYADGLLSFYPYYQGTPSNNRPIPYWDRPDLYIAGFWDDLDPSRGEGVYTGIDARGRFVVQYEAIPLAGTPTPEGRFTFQIILDPSGAIVMQYGPMTGSTTSATVGIENETSSAGLQVAYNQPYVHDGLAVRIARGDPWLSVIGGGTLAPGTSTEVGVTFSSHELRAGTLSSSVLLNSNDPAAPTHSVPVALTLLSQPDIELSTGELDFGAVYVGGPRTDSLLVLNRGTGPLTVSSVSTDGASFLAAIEGSTTLAPGEHREIRVSFAPTSAGPFSGTLTVATDDPDEPSLAVALSGEGLLAPSVVVTPASLSASVEAGQTATRVLTVANDGDSDLSFGLDIGRGDAAIDSLHYDFGGSTAGTYGWTPYLPFTVANRFTADGAFTLSAVRAYLKIQRDPTVRVEIYRAGSFGVPTSGQLIWSRDVSIEHGPGRLFTIPLDTTFAVADGEDFYIVIGTQEEFSPFGAHHSNGGRSYYRTPYGPEWYHETSSVTWVIRALTTTGAWLDAQPMVGSVPAGGSQEVMVTFDATAVSGGNYTSTIVVESNDPVEPEVTVPVAFTVSGIPNLVLSPDSLVFGPVYLGASRVANLRVRNLGTGALSVSAIASSHAVFTHAPSAPFTLAPGATDTLHVTFTPVEAAPHVGTLTITSNDPDTPDATVALRGEGVAFPAISVVPDSVSVAILAGDSTSATVTLANAGPGPLSYVIEAHTGHAPAGGPDSYGYTWTDSDRPGGPTFRWTDISSSGTALALGDDSWQDVELPFSFPFYGDDKAAVRVASNGYLTFGSQRGDVWDAKPIPHSWPPNDFIAPYWTDLDPSAGGTVHYAPDAEGRFVVQYTDVTTHSAPSWRTTFQVILEPAGTIVFQYLRRTAPFSGTIGIENAAATDGLQISHNQFPPYVRDSLAVRIDPPTSWLSVEPASGTIAPGAQEEVVLSLAADSLEQGTYRADLRITSNDPIRPLVRVPVVVDVSGALRIALSAGWNLVSWNIQPASSRVDSVLATILARVQAVETYEGGQRRWYVPGHPGSTLSTLMPTYGYWVRLSADAILELHGTPVDQQTALPLVAGVNAVSYLPWRASGVGYALGSVMSVTETAASFQGTGVTYAPGVPADFHVMDRMQPKAGYLIRASAPGTLVYPTTAAGQTTGSTSRPTVEGRLQAEAASGVTPSMAWLDVWGEDLRFADGTPLPVGTRVTATDSDGRAVGAFDVVVDGRLGLMAIYADDPYTPEKDGAAVGEPITLHFGDVVLPAALTWTAPGDLVNLSHVVVAGESEPGNVPTEFELQDTAPNPFSDQTAIRFSLPEPARVRLIVYDALGRVAATLLDGERPAGRHAVVWDGRGAASGTYVIALQAGHHRASRRVTLLR